MDARFRISGFPPNPASSSFKILGKSVQVQEPSDDDHEVNTLLQLDSGNSSKRKWNSTGLEEASALIRKIGQQSSSSSGICSAKETDDESSGNLDLQLSLSTGMNTTQDLSRTTTQISSVSCSSGIINISSNIKPCLFDGCRKGARGGFGLCISHGGGRRCQRDGCDKGAEGKTVFCKAHGGGRRCDFLGCTKSAEGKTDFCIAHGGGRRCTHDGCTRAARGGGTGLCIRHGGGKRCTWGHGAQTGPPPDGPVCTRSAEGLSGLCISHGGGRRCQYPGCTKGAQGRTQFCKGHGGGKRCTHEGCTKGAEGSTPFCKGHGGGKRCSFPGCYKCVHGGTMFCVAHGGGKRCVFPECTKSARGRTDRCVRHGGGKRCRHEGGGCGKSAQGKTDFCKAHGGGGSGKRCGYEAHGSDPCGSFSRGKAGLCATHGALVEDNRVHGGATLGALVHDPEENASLETMVVTNVDLMKKGKHLDISDGMEAEATPPGGAQEGRVHGGSLMALLSGGKSSQIGSSDPMKMPRNWI